MVKKKLDPLHEFACHPCARGHASHLCIDPTLVYVAPKQLHNGQGNQHLYPILTTVELFSGLQGMLWIPLTLPAAISPDGLLVQCREQKAWQGCRSTRGVSEGKVYYEATVTDEGLCRVGWTTAHGSLELGESREEQSYLEMYHS